MQLSDLYTTDRHEEGAELVVKDEYGKDTNLVLILKGRDSKAYRDGRRAHQKAVIEAMTNKQNLDSLDDEKLDVDTFVAMTIGWKGTDEEFSEKLCRELYTKAPYVRDQVDLFIGNRANFTKG